MRITRSVDRLRKELTTIESKEGVERAEVHVLIQKIRQVLESDRGLHVQFNVLMLYCNWFLHDQLDRKPNFVVIEEVARAFGERWCGQGDEIIHAGVSKALDLRKLRDDLLMMFALHKLPMFVLSSYRTYSFFLTNILNELCEKPIRAVKSIESVEERQEIKLIENLKTLSNPAPWFPYYLSFDHNTDISGNRTAGFWWCVRVSGDGNWSKTTEKNYVEIRGPLSFPHQEDEFVHP